MKEILKSFLPCSFFLLVLVTPLMPQDAGKDTASAQDSWLAFDKVQHATFSFLLVLSTQYLAVNKYGFREHEAFPVSFTATAVIGVLKELRDAEKPSGYISKRDLMANGVGLLLGSAIILIGGGR